MRIFFWNTAIMTMLEYVDIITELKVNSEVGQHQYARQLGVCQRLHVCLSVMHKIPILIAQIEIKNNPK